MKTVAIVDWHWVGHHPTYFRLFILALEELGFDVLAICPAPEKASEAVARSKSKATLDGSQRGKTEFLKINVPRRRFHVLRAPSLTAMDWSVRLFAGVESQIRKWSQCTGRQVDLVFYACMYSVDFEWIHFAKPFLHLPWAGLLIEASNARFPDRKDPYTGIFFRPQKQFAGGLCKGLAILDEGVAHEISNAIGKPAVIFPDVADEELILNGSGCPLGERLKQFAAGRPIVGLFGFLQISKGLLAFLEAAELMAPRGICFALGGNLALLPSAEADRIYQYLNECTNVWDHLTQIPDGNQFNSLLQCCDITYAAYLNFPYSSNIMTKAASLKRPLIVSDGYLMAERVRRFNMGEVIPEGDAAALVKAVSKIVESPEAWIAENNPKWDAYSKEHSFERLKASWKQLLSVL